MGVLIKRGSQDYGVRGGVTKDSGVTWKTDSYDTLGNRGGRKVSAGFSPQGHENTVRIPARSYNCLPSYLHTYISKYIGPHT